MGGLILLPLRLRVKALPEGTEYALPELVIEVPDLEAPAPAPLEPGPAPTPGADLATVPSDLNPFSYAVTQRIGQQLTGYNTVPHTGVDFGMPCGVPIAALRHGVVTFAGGADPKTGNLVAIRYDDGVYAYFAHLDSIGATFIGQEVWPDTTIGYCGDSGAAVGCHLHLELHTSSGHLGTSNALVDPLAYFA